MQLCADSWSATKHQCAIIEPVFILGQFYLAIFASSACYYCHFAMALIFAFASPSKQLDAFSLRFLLAVAKMAQNTEQMLSKERPSHLICLSDYGFSDYFMPLMTLGLACH